MRIMRFRPSPALIVASLALAIALGGTGYAAVVLPANSVGTKQLKNKAVNAAKVKPGSLRASSFASGLTVLPRQTASCARNRASSFASGQLPTGAKGDRGADGLPGAAGPSGPQGAKGDPATKLFAVVDGATGKPTVKSAGVDSNKTGSGSNTYAVTFPQSVSDCAPLVTVGFTGSGDGGQATAAVAAPGANVVNVATFDEQGGSTPKGFAIAVFC